MGRSNCGSNLTILKSPFLWSTAERLVSVMMNVDDVDSSATCWSTAVVLAGASGGGL